MLARIRSASLHGLDAVPVLVEVSITNGLPAFHVVGLPDAAVRESRARVVSALRECGFQFPLRRITVNLAPAHRRKEGSAFDLPIALAVLAASGQVAADRVQGWVVVGELALDGTLRRVRGTLAIAESAKGDEAVVVPAANAREAAFAESAPVFAARNLAEVIGWVTGRAKPMPFTSTEAQLPLDDPADPGALDAIVGQEMAKRALTIAAAGGHHLLLVGPPGVGKTMLARALPSLLPPLTKDEARAVARVASVAGLVVAGEDTPTGIFAGPRPFRAPHSSVSLSALIGGGPGAPRPGEITLAHHGVLFLDEAPEFRRDALEALRGPLEDGTITLARRGGAHRFPARFQLVAAMNPCRCGFKGSAKRSCRCTPTETARYRARLSEPLLDRIDLRIDVPPSDARELTRKRHTPSREHTDTARTLIRTARIRQLERATRLGVPATNALFTPADLERAAPLTDANRDHLRNAIANFHLSARAHHRTWRLARTIADLAGEESIGANAIDEALALRGEA